MTFFCKQTFGEKKSGAELYLSVAALMPMNSVEVLNHRRRGITYSRDPWTRIYFKNIFVQARSDEVVLSIIPKTLTVNW
jgi:hypothetical protein